MTMENLDKQKDAFIYTEYNVVEQSASKLKGMALESLIKWIFEKSEVDKSFFKEKQIQSILSELTVYGKNIFKVSKKFALITNDGVFHNFNSKPEKNDDVIFDLNIYYGDYKIFFNEGLKKRIVPLQDVRKVKDYLLTNGFIEFFNLSESTLKKRLDLVRIVDDKLVIYESKNYEKSFVGLNELVQVLMYSLAFKRCGVDHKKVDLIFNGNVKSHVFGVCGLWFRKYHVFIEVLNIKKVLFMLQEKKGIVVKKLLMLPKNLGIGDVIHCGVKSEYYLHVIYDNVKDLKFYNHVSLFILEDSTLDNVRGRHDYFNIVLKVKKVFPVKNIKDYVITDMILSDGVSDISFSYFGDDKKFSSNDVIYLVKAFIKNFNDKRQISYKKEGELFSLV